MPTTRNLGRCVAAAAVRRCNTKCLNVHLTGLGACSTVRTDLNPLSCNNRFNHPGNVLIWYRVMREQNPVSLLWQG